MKSIENAAFLWQNQRSAWTSKLCLNKWRAKHVSNQHLLLAAAPLVAANGPPTSMGVFHGFPSCWHMSRGKKLLRLAPMGFGGLVTTFLARLDKQMLMLTE